MEALAAGLAIGGDGDERGARWDALLVGAAVAQRGRAVAGARLDAVDTTVVCHGLLRGIGAGQEESPRSRSLSPPAQEAACCHAGRTITVLIRELSRDLSSILDP